MLKEISQVLSIEKQDSIRKAKIGHFKGRLCLRLKSNDVLIRKQKIARPMPSEVKELYMGRKKIMKASE